MKRISLLCSLALMLIFVLAACGETSSGTTLDVNASQFNYGQDEFRVKAGEPVTVNFKSTDVTHGFAIDEFNVNISGEGTAEFTPEEPGEYTIYCTVVCGEGHPDMQSTLIVE